MRLHPLASLCGIIGFSAVLAAFQSSASSPSPAPAHNWTVNADVSAVDDPNTQGAEDEVTTPDGTTVKNGGTKAGDPSIRVKYCPGSEPPNGHAAHTEVTANGAGDNCDVTVGGNGANVTVDGGTGKDSGSRINVTGSGNTVNTKGNNNCATAGGDHNTVNHAGGSGNGNHTHSPPQPPPH